MIVRASGTGWRAAAVRVGWRHRSRVPDVGRADRERRRWWECSGRREKSIAWMVAPRTQPGWRKRSCLGYWQLQRPVL